MSLFRHPGLVPGSTGPQAPQPVDARRGGPRHKAGVTVWLILLLALLFGLADWLTRPPPLPSFAQVRERWRPYIDSRVIASFEHPALEV